MLETLLCAMVTILPDYLFRRYGQGKRIGREITLFSVWYELRWGLVACGILTVTLLTLIFYFHPSTTNAVAAFRVVPILPERSGRVAEVAVANGQRVEAGEVLLRLDDEAQRAAAETARRRVAEIDAALAVAGDEIAAAEGQLRAAESALREAQGELETRRELVARNPDVVSRRELERLEAVADARAGGVDAARASAAAARSRATVLLPAQKASAEAALAEAIVALDQTVLHAGFAGVVEQFALRVGDVVSPLMRPAGVMVPVEAGRRRVAAGFGQIEAQVVRPGMAAEISCAALPLRVIPMVVVDVQEALASGQFGVSDALVDLSAMGREGTLLAFLEPVYPDGLDGLPPGARCIANAYTSTHERRSAPDVGALQAFGLHAIEAVGVVHAAMMRVQALLLPARTLVLGGH